MVYHPIFIKHDKVFVPRSKRYIQLHTSHRSSTGAINYKAHFVYFLILQFQCVKECRTANDSCTMLIIMPYWYGKLVSKFTLYIKAFRGFNVFKVDTSECGLQCFYYLYKFLWVGFVYFYIKYIYIGE